MLSRRWMWQSQVKHFSNKMQDGLREQAGICIALWRCSSPCPERRARAAGPGAGKALPSGCAQERQLLQDLETRPYCIVTSKAPELCGTCLPASFCSRLCVMCSRHGIKRRDHRPSLGYSDRFPMTTNEV
ncbi:uncharacterized protein ACIBXB_022184 [Morphnus guianensis]